MGGRRQEGRHETGIVPLLAARRNGRPLATNGRFCPFPWAATWAFKSWPRANPERIGVSIELKPHAYDPAAKPELFEGVLARRVVAFLIDFVILSIPVVFVAMFIFVFGIVTFGLGWFLFYGCYGRPW